jgi:hypothetical protein
MVWKNEQIPYPVIINPNECSLLLEVKEKLESHISFDSAKETTVTSALARVIKGERKSYKGWFVSLFLQPSFYKESE